MSRDARGSWFPGAAVAWLGFAVLLFVLSFIEVPLHDPRFAGASAVLTPHLWLPVFGLGGPALLHISAFQTGLSLTWAALGFAVIEAGLAFYYYRREEKLVRPLVRMVEIFLVFWSCFGHLAIWDTLLNAIFPSSPALLYPRNTVIGFAEVHLNLVIISSVVTVVLGLALGILVTRAAFEEFLPLVSNFVSSGQTLPTIAVVAIMVPIIGFGFWPTVIALILYGMLPVLRNTIAGLEAVDNFLIDSARGMGMTPLQILLHIELPNASSIILAGIRTSVVINVGTAALGAYAGSGGLGVPIAGGLSQNIFPFVLEGAVPAALLAILVDYILGRLEYVVTPKGLQIEG